EIKIQKPDFYKWYFEKPVLDVANDIANSHGAHDEPLTVVAFSHFAGGHCSALDHSLWEVLGGSQQDQVRVVYRHFPLDAECNPSIETTIHPQACLAAAAAECAADQGKFWPYHQLLFEHQGQFKRSDLIGYAQDAGIDVAKFEACLQAD